MLKTLWKSLQRKEEQETGEVSVDYAKWKLFFEHFPIGKKLRYYPEYREEIAFQTIILGYRANRKFLYSRDAVVFDTSGEPAGFKLSDGKLLVLEKIEDFQLLVPDTSEMERTLDYFTRAELGRAGQFRKGNTITLVVDTTGPGIPTVDTLVDRRQTLTTGPFADTPTVLVTPDFSSLVLADQRRRQRVQTDIPAGLYLRLGTRPFVCALGDFSETSLRLRVTGSGEAMPEMDPEQSVTVAFGLDETEDGYRLRGKVFRRTDDSCVVTVEQIFRGGRFEPIRTMDILEIKTGLLNRYG